MVVLVVANAPSHVHGEMIKHGPRKPAPMLGPGTNSSGYSLCEGGWGGVTWLKCPSFSS